MNIILNFIFIILFLNKSAFSSISSHLNYHETISTNEINHRIHKRSIDSSVNQPTIKEFKQVEFDKFNRRFRLILNEKNQILADHFKAYSIDQFGKKKEVHFDPSEFYEGNIIDRQKSHVTAHIEKKTGLITGSIYDDDENEAYFIEPYSNLMGANKSKEHENLMIIYRQSDMKDQSLNDDLKRRLNHHLNNSTGLDYIKINETVDEPNVTRFKRQLDDDNFWSESKLENSRCSLKLVADYTFVEQMGNQEASKTINFLVNLISEVDTIFKRTNWTYTDSDDEPMFGYGFLVTEIEIHEKPFFEYSSDLNTKHYNMMKERWKVRDLLETFSRANGHRSFCLAHLFTHRTFENGILGLAYVSSPRQYSYGGICSQPYYKDGSFLYLNTGLTTTKNSFGNRVLTRQAILITAHELGHNFGSEHDPSIPECSPKAKNGGGYIMNTFSVSSYDSNNQFFSICSRRSIKAVLKVKAKDCFSKPKSTFCGNGIVEKGEECDPGLATSPNGDSCCTKNCKLKAGAQCSDRNSPCCNSRCQFSGPSRVCLDSNELDCKRESHCNGHSAQCPKPFSLPDGTPCSEDGQCVNGECIPFCEKHGLHSCMCDRVADACRKCCKMSQINSTCEPYPFSDGYHFHRDGTICLRGFCSKNKCINVTSQDYVERFWSIIDDIEYNSFTMFLKDNLVFFVILLSLIFFLPICWLIDKYDSKMKEKELERSKTSKQMRAYNESDRQASSLYGNQSIRTHSRRQLPANRQQFSTNIQGRQFRRVMDESPSAPRFSNNSNNSNHTTKQQNSTQL